MKYLLAAAAIILIIAGSWLYLNRPEDLAESGTGTGQADDAEGAAGSQAGAEEASSIKDWKTYSNPEFGFSIQYPAKFDPFVTARSGQSLISDSQAIVSFEMDAVMVIVDRGAILEQVFEAVKKTFVNNDVETGTMNIAGSDVMYVHVKDDPNSPVYVYALSNNDVVYRLFVIDEEFAGAEDRERFVSSFRLTF